jgi:hypothetical protein
MSEDKDIRPADTPNLLSRPASTLISHDDIEKNVSNRTSAVEPEEHHVDVQQAKKDFAALERQFSRASQASSKRPDDVEKGGVAESEDYFDLRDYLATSHEANTAAGIRHKHVGVTWKDLTVQVPNMGSRVSIPFATTDNRNALTQLSAQVLCTPFPCCYLGDFIIPGYVPA